MEEQDWLRVEEIIRKACTVGGLSPQEQALIERAHRTDQPRYAKLSQAIKDEEIEKARRFGRGE